MYATTWVESHASFPFASPKFSTSSPKMDCRRICQVSRVPVVVSGLRVQYPPQLFRCTLPLLQRSAIVRRNAPFRSEHTASAGFDDSSSTYSRARFQLVSRTRGLLFYVLTAVISIPLFVAMVVVHPFVMLFDQHRRSVHHIIAKWWASLTVAPFFKVEYEGLENLPPDDTSAVFVSNHQSFLDIYTLLTLGRNFKFISKTAIFLIPIAGWAMYLMGLIRLRRMDRQSQLDCLKRCINLVKSGASVFFFPEGTRSKDGKLGVFKKGAFSIAAKTGVPVVPITLLGAGKLMPAGMENFLNEGSVKIVIHRPIEGNNVDELCTQARKVIADTLFHGYGVQ